MKKLCLILLLATVCRGYVADKPILGVSLNGDHDLSRGLVGVWLFNEPTGVLGQVQDLSGNGLHGTLVATAQSSPGKFGPAISLDGDSDFIDFGAMGDRAEGVAALSISIWVFADDATSNNQYIWSQHGAGNDTFLLHWPTTEDINFIVFTSVTSATASFMDGIPSGHPPEWYHIVGVYDGTNVRVYVNDVVGGTVGSLTGVTQASPSDVVIGARSTKTERFFHGQIDHASMWVRGLTPAEVTSLNIRPFQMFEQERLPIASAAAPPSGAGQLIMIMGSVPLIVVFVAFSFWFSGRKAA